jgi:nitrile hydratase accessory protein
LIAGDLPTAVPRRNGELVFGAPWESRAFGMVAAYLDTTGNSWEHFRPHLIAAIAESPDETPYYESWVHALEDMLAADGVAVDAVAGS